MFLEIVTPEASIVTAEINSVTVPGVDGKFQMLKNHASILSLLEQGTVSFEGTPKITAGFENRFFQDKKGNWSIEISGGTVEVNDNKIIVLAD